MELKTTFGNRLKLRRTNCGLLQKELAEKVGITNRNISSYEKNDREPAYDTLIKIAKALDCSTDYLLGISDEPNYCTTRIPYIEDDLSRLIKMYQQLNKDGQTKILEAISDYVEMPKYTVKKGQEYA